MLKEIPNSKNNDFLNDFSCFNRVLYDNFDYDEDKEQVEYNNNKFKNENNISDDESSINTSCQSIEYK